MATAYHYHLHAGGLQMIDAQTPLMFPPHKAARTSDPQTSHDTARTVATFAGSHSEKCLAVIGRYGKAGQSLIAERTGLLPHQINKRLNDLHLDGQIMPTSETVASHSGRRERLWILAPSPVTV